MLFIVCDLWAKRHSELIKLTFLSAGTQRKAVAFIQATCLQILDNVYVIIYNVLNGMRLSKLNT